MQQLSAREAEALAADNGHANGNVSLVHIHDQSTAPEGRVRFKTLLAHIESRLGSLPLVRRRLQRVPLGVDRPYWVDDERFDLEYHVRHIALPKPGDWRQFCIQVSRIHARALDLDRPPWEIYVIEGLDSFADLPPGSFALLARTHRALIEPGREDGFISRLYDATPDVAAVPPPSPWFAAPAPALLPLVARGAVLRLVHPRRLLAPVARRLRALAPAPLVLAGGGLLRGADTPLVRFNAVVSPHRVFETRRFAPDEVERIRALVPGAGVDAVALAVCGGALRRYLQAHDELPRASLAALLPPADGAAGDDERRVTLATDVEDPLQRLRTVHAALTGAAAPPPAGSASLVQRAAQALALRHAPLAACRITPLPAPQAPQYLCGARLTYVSALLPIADGMGLAIAVTQYEGRLVLSPTSCRQLMPDPERFAQALRDSFQELLALAASSRRRRARAAAG